MGYLDRANAWFAALSPEQKEELFLIDREWYTDTGEPNREVEGVVQDWIEENGGKREWFWNVNGHMRTFG